MVNDLILLVDDDKLNLKLLQEILQKDGYKVAAATSGEQAIAFVSRTIPNLILMDVSMPGMDGFETVERITAMENGKNVPIVFLTAKDDVETEIHGFELGADDFIKKPFVSSIVTKRVSRTLEAYHLRNSLQEEVSIQTAEVQKRKNEIEQMSIEIIQILATAIDAKDPYTRGHSSRVSEYSVALAKKLGWKPERLENLRIMAMLHDVGKISIPDRVLNNPGKLSDGEYEVIKTHTTYGHELLLGVSSLASIADVARHHHERYDGKGYPDHLKGDEISIEARIVGIADSYDAMSSNRIYRRGLKDSIVHEELIKGRGTQFDPELLDLFVEAIDAGQIVPNQDVESSSADIYSFIGEINKEDDNKPLEINHDELLSMYNYLKKVNERDGKCFSMILISMSDVQGIADDQLYKAMAAMEYSILLCLKKSDMTCRVSNTQHVILLAEDANENISTVLEKIFAGFYKNCLNTDIKPKYEIIYKYS